jgi:hypothetical protein
MNRVWDYIGFAVWFAGVGYIVLRLLGSPGHLALPPALHAIGLASAMFVAVRLLLHAVGRRRRAAVGVGAASALPARRPTAILWPPRRKPARALRPVKPRSHFGLRGMPH